MKTVDKVPKLPEAFLSATFKKVLKLIGFDRNLRLFADIASSFSFSGSANKSLLTQFSFAASCVCVIVLRVDENHTTCTFYCNKFSCSNNKPMTPIVEVVQKNAKSLFSTENEKQFRLING